MTDRSRRNLLQHEIKTLTDELTAAEFAKEENDIQIDMCRICLSILRTNIRILKAEKIVTILSEYKKAREEEKEMTQRLVTLTNTMCAIDAHIEKVKPKLETLLAEYKTIKIDPGNVIQFRGKKNG